MIPRIIHMFWAGDMPLPILAENVKKAYPGWTIKVWTEADMPRHNRNVQWCIEHQQWSVLSDLCRHWAVYNHGGMYIDTDMEAKRPIMEVLRPCQWFAALERPKFVNCALSGGQRGNEISRVLMEAWFASDWPGYVGRVPIASAAGPYLQTEYISRILPPCKALDRIQATGHSNGYIYLIPEHIAFGNGYRAYHQGRRPHPDALFIHHWTKAGR